MLYKHVYLPGLANTQTKFWDLALNYESAGVFKSSSTRELRSIT